MSKGEECIARCDRLHARSIERKGVNGADIEQILEKQKPAPVLKDVCWRLFDRLDCLKNCPREKELDKYARDVRFKCKGVLGDLASELKCVSKYRSFMQVKCSTFLKEAVSLRVTQEQDSVPDRETCRYLHLNSLCLENTVGNYCPSATRVFRRLNFRDYFLNFIVPENDLLFDDFDLDSCQIYDFVKIAKGVSEEEEDELTTMIKKWEEDEKSTNPITTTTTQTSTTTAQEKQKFTTLLNELLDSASTKALTSTELYETTSGELLELLEGTMTVKDQVPDLLEGQGTVVHLDGDQSTEYTTYKLDPETSTSPSFTKKTTLEENRVIPVSTSTSSTEYDDTTIIIPSSIRNIFSDDSMENTPPNFFWSSARYRSSTLSANNGRHLSSMEIVQPVEVDTSTLLGDDFPQGVVEIEPVWTTKAPELSLLPPKIVVKSSLVSTTPRSTSRIAVSFSPKANARIEVHTRAQPSTVPSTVMTNTAAPLLSGGVVVKTIKRWGEPESDEEGRESEKMQRSPMLDEEELDRRLSTSKEYESHEEVTQDSTDRLSDKEILIFIYLILFGLALLSLICILLFCACCKRKPASIHGSK